MSASFTALKSNMPYSCGTHREAVKTGTSEDFTGGPSTADGESLYLSSDKEKASREDSVARLRSRRKK